MFWPILFLCALSLVNCESEDQLKCSVPCKAGQRCDGFANKCRNSGSSCVNDCQKFTYCGFPDDICTCDNPIRALTGGAQICNNGICPAGFSCNICGFCYPDNPCTPDLTPANPTVENPCTHWQNCDRLANKCRKAQLPSCANDCPKWTFCNHESNLCQCYPESHYPAGTQNCTNGTCPADFTCNLCGYCLLENACNPPCSSDWYKCDYLANKCRYFYTGDLWLQPSCANDCPEWTFCDSVKNLCQCHPEHHYPAGTQTCSNVSCSSGFECNRCNYCLPINRDASIGNLQESKNVGAQVIMATNFILLITSFVFGSQFML